MSELPPCPTFFLVVRFTRSKRLYTPDMFHSGRCSASQVGIVQLTYAILSLAELVVSFWASSTLEDRSHKPQRPLSVVLWRARLFLDGDVCSTFWLCNRVDLLCLQQISTCWQVCLIRTCTRVAGWLDLIYRNEVSCSDPASSTNDESSDSFAVFMLFFNFHPVIPHNRRTSQKSLVQVLLSLDWIGTFLATAGTVLTLVGFNQANTRPWGDSLVLGPMIVGLIVVFGIFPAWCYFAKDPIVKRSLFLFWNYVSEVSMPSIRC